MSHQNTVTDKVELINNVALFHYYFSREEEFLMDPSYLQIHYTSG